MLTRDYKAEDVPVGEILHPIENRKLNLDEKTKFLRELSAFFAISDPEQMQACWNVELSAWEFGLHMLDSMPLEHTVWELLPDDMRTEMIQGEFQHLFKSCHNFKRKFFVSAHLKCPSALPYLEENLFAVDQV
jgi:hypothetical protein